VEELLQRGGKSLNTEKATRHCDQKNKRSKKAMKKGIQNRETYGVNRLREKNSRTPKKDGIREGEGSGITFPAKNGKKGKNIEGKKGKEPLSKNVKR